MLTHTQVLQFIHKGYIAIPDAFPASLAEECRTILWRDTGCNPHDKDTWTKPVIRLGDYGQQPFKKAANTAVLHAAFNRLAGAGRWQPRESLGTFPVRFPGGEQPGDDGWHVDASFPGDEPSNFLEWKINIHSKGRALLMLFLFSDVGIHDAPTRIRAGSHLDVARMLQPAGVQGLSFMQLAARLHETAYRDEVLAVGKAGTVYLCHPFIVHAAQAHTGSNPRFMSQPPLVYAGGVAVNGKTGGCTPVETAIRMAIYDNREEERGSI